MYGKCHPFIITDCVFPITPIVFTELRRPARRLCNSYIRVARIGNVIENREYVLYNYWLAFSLHGNIWMVGLF